MTYGVRQPGSVTKQVELFDQDAGEQASEEHWVGDGCHAHGKFAEMPARLFTDDEVLGLTDQGADAPQCGTDGRVHHEASQEGAELVQMLAGKLVNLLVVVVQVTGLVP